MSLGEPLLAIVGPTASGKTRMAIEVATELPFDVEILSCDSMAVYRGIDVLSAKPTPDERAAVPHHLIDLVDPHEPFSVAEYAAAARKAAAAVRDRGAVPMVVGGSGLYFRAAVDGLELAPTDPALRAQLERQQTRELLQRLRSIDPDTRVHPSNRRRIVRALEVAELTGGRPEGWDRRAPVTVAGLMWDRATLYARIEQRVDRMLADGLVDEVRRALEAGVSMTAAQAVGIKEVAEHARARGSLQDARAALIRNTKRFVRRQDAWFRADPRIEWVDASSWDAARAEIVRRFGRIAPM